MNFTDIFLEAVKECADFHQGIDIIKNNSNGNSWLVGGFIYRTIASKLYGCKRPEVDLDFVIELPVKDFTLPDKWGVKMNRFGNPKLFKGNQEIDYVPLNNVYSIIRRNIAPTIDNFLSGVPLTIQAIAYDVNAGKVIGEVGIKAILDRVIQVNDLYFAEYAALKKEISLNDIIREKAQSLEFSPIFPTR